MSHESASISNGREGLRLAYVCSDPGIPFFGPKGASVHFRQLAKALLVEGAQPHAFVARSKRVHTRESKDAHGLGDASAQAALEIPLTTVAKPRGVASTALRSLASSVAVRTALEEAGDFDAVYERYSLFSFAGADYARAHDVPFVIEVNAPLWDEAARYRDLDFERSAKALALECFERADRVFVVSPVLGEMLEADGVPEAKISVLPNGVDEDLFGQGDRAAIPEHFAGRPVMVFVGSLKPWHGVDFLLDAHERLEAANKPGLWIVGKGPLGERVERAVRERPHDIYWSEGVDHAEIPRILRAADLSVAPYPLDAPGYFCPLKIVEAIAVGCTVVASDHACVRAFPDLAPGIETFAAGRQDAFAAAVTRALARDPAPNRARELSWRRNARRVLDTIEALSCKAGGRA